MAPVKQHDEIIANCQTEATRLGGTTTSVIDTIQNQYQIALRTDPLTARTCIQQADGIIRDTFPGLVEEQVGKEIAKVGSQRSSLLEAYEDFLDIQNKLLADLQKAETDLVELENSLAIAAEEARIQRNNNNLIIGLIAGAVALLGALIGLGGTILAHYLKTGRLGPPPNTPASTPTASTPNSSTPSTDDESTQPPPNLLNSCKSTAPEHNFGDDHWASLYDPNSHHSFLVIAAAASGGGFAEATIQVFPEGRNNSEVQQ